MYVVIEDETDGVDALVIEDVDLTKTADTISFSVNIAVTNTLTPSFNWALRDQTTNEVYLKGTLYVEPAATRDV